MTATASMTTAYISSSLISFHLSAAFAHLIHTVHVIAPPSLLSTSLPRLRFTFIHLLSRQRFSSTSFRFPFPPRIFLPKDLVRWQFVPRFIVFGSVLAFTWRLDNAFPCRAVSSSSLSRGSLLSECLTSSVPFVVQPLTIPLFFLTLPAPQLVITPH